MLRYAVVVVALCLVLTGCGGDENIGPPLAPVADVSQLMTMIIDPAADAIWDSVGIVVDADGFNEWYPVTDEEWAVVMNGAMTITEGANLLMLGERARDQDAWMRMAQGLSDAGRQAIAAAESRDYQAIYEVSETVYNSCDNCHNLYWTGDQARGRVRNPTP
jgi:hypothetical protein